MVRVVQWCSRVVCLLVLMGCFSTSALAQDKAFDHAETGFELTGGHNFTPCESCHVGGQFAGTPTECVACHSVNGRINATPKPVEHIFVSERCDACHSTVGFQAVPVVDHHEVFGRCETCHNNIVVAGKPIDHIPVQNDCVDCHSDLGWQPVSFTHDNLTGRCESCHNNISALGQPVDHINASMECEACHSTTTFSPVIRVDHDYVVGTCASCHLADKPINHINIRQDAQCDSCHTSTQVWPSVPVVNHDLVVGTCRSCHDGVIATGQFVGHRETGNLECNVCHLNTIDFSDVISF